VNSRKHINAGKIRIVTPQQLESPFPSLPFHILSYALRNVNFDTERNEDRALEVSLKLSAEKE